MGLPADWNVVEAWCKKPFYFGLPITPGVEEKDSKFGELDFSSKAEPQFWEKFPSRKLPDKPSMRINVKNLEKTVKTVAEKMTLHQRLNARTAISNLEEGAPAFQLKRL